MEKYISKSVVLAEINRLYREHSGRWGCDEVGVNLEYLEDFIDALEVKEVDLELNSFDATVCKIGSTYLKEMNRDAIANALEPYKNGDKVKVIIKVQKG